MNWLIGTLLAWYYMGLSIFHIFQTLIFRGVVRSFDLLFGTDMYYLKTRPFICQINFEIWKKYREVYKKYFPDEVEELKLIDQELDLIQRDLE